MRIVIDIDPAAQEFATEVHQDVEAIIRRRLLACRSRAQFQGFICTIVGVVDENYGALLPYIAPPMEAK